MRYYAANGKRHPFIYYGNLGPQGTITKSKYKLFSYEVGNLPDSIYAPAKLKLSDVEKGLLKYFNPIIHPTKESIFNDLVITFKLPVTPDKLETLILEEFSTYFPGIERYMDEKLSFDRVVYLMSHDLKGDLRKKTSAGIGFKHDRKEIARLFIDDIRSCYELDTFDFHILWKLFLKDELRETDKDTRSIAVPQLHLWVIAMSHLGGLYEWFSDYLPSWSGYGLDDRSFSWHQKFKDFNPSRVTYGFDLRKQDSRMSPGFIQFIEYYIKTITPIKHWNAIEWFFNESFYAKKIVDTKGHILSFSQGEMSGNPFTILINTMHNLFTHVIHTVIMDLKGDDLSQEIFVVLGDDTIMQSSNPDLYKEVCLLLGHETTTESGSLYDDVTFLSQKITIYKGEIVSYYSNLEKMYASLRYTTSGINEYFMKMCSYHAQLIFAPKGTEEHEWRQRIEAHILYYLQTKMVPDELTACFKPAHIIKRKRIGFDYHTNPGVGLGGLNLEFTDVSN
jgi:hypothetical protein